jgi:DMSO reductase anchor subunit
MHPAFSVIFFTTMSGAGYGLWFWLGLMPLLGHSAPRPTALIVLALGFVLTSLGLLSSTLHLGKPQRAWRAFSQWRSSWLSREGVLAMTCLLPAAWFALGAMRGQDVLLAGALLAALAVATVACTAMIYASLKTIPAWSHAAVLPVYLLFAWFTGGLIYAAVCAATGVAIGNDVAMLALVGCFVLWRLKHHYWREIDRGALPSTRASALGLPADREVRVFERPHTEANYLTREMGFVLARKHSRRLRRMAMVIFALLPGLLVMPVWLFVHVDPLPWLCAAALSALSGAFLSALSGAFLERWLFFAEAKHLVTLYY